MEKDIVDYALEYVKGKNTQHPEIREQSDKNEQLISNNGILAYLSKV